MAGRSRTALFVDFDNIFTGLLALDPDAAQAFAERPQEWLERLAVVGDSLPARDFLVRRCYMNPSGWRIHPRLGGERIFFSRYRPFLTRAGFEVIDCPALTARHKNAADIRLALDVVDALQHPTRFDEFVVFSGDADFTPLLQRLRAHDRRTAVAASTQTATAFRGIADVFLDEQALIDLVLGTDGEADDVPAALPEHPLTDEEIAALRAQAVARVIEMVAASSGPVHLAKLGLALRGEMGEVITATHWFGTGSLKNAITAPATEHLRMSQHLIWDPDRHDPGADEPPAPAGSDMPAVALKVCRVSGMPPLPAARLAAVFAKLASYRQDGPFNLTEITKALRDELQAEGTPVNRQAISYIVKGVVMYGHRELDTDPPPTPEDLAATMARVLLQNPGVVQMELTEQERADVTAWICGPGHALPEPAEPEDVVEVEPVGVADQADTDLPVTLEGPSAL
jgi:hypothetical protein